MRFLIILLALFLTGCEMQEKPVEVTRTVVETPRLILPDPAPVTMRPVVWKVLPGDPTYIALDSANYTNLSVNMARLQQHIIELFETLKKYKEFYQEGNK